MTCAKVLTAADADEGAQCPVCKSMGLWHKTEVVEGMSVCYVLCPDCCYAEYECIALNGRSVVFDYETSKYKTE